MIKTLRLAIFLWLILPAFAWAQDQSPKFVLPLDCVQGETCWVVDYVDTDPAENSGKDFKCGSITTDDNRGVHFALPSRGEMLGGVDVYAAMDGEVMRLRDGESDSVKTEEELAAIKEARKECGNAVLLDHEEQGFGALNTLYCHLKLGSLSVKVGDKVKAGQKIGEVGQSGYAQFPRLHFGVVWKGGVVDPFTGVSNTKGCKQAGTGLWKDAPTYDPLIIFAGGFRNGTPDFTAIKEGQKNPETLSISGEALTYWVGFFQTQNGDEIEMTIRHENGEEIISRHIIVEEGRALPSFYYTGRILDGEPLPAGTYIGETKLTRNGLIPKTIRHFVNLQ